MCPVFTSRFLNIDVALAASLSQQFGSPLYLIDETGIVQRLRDFKQAVVSRYAHSIVSISYKTNLLYGLLGILHKQGVYAEVVSGEEFDVARLLNVPKNEIIFNGPMKTDKELREIILSDIYFHCDHLDEVCRVERLASEFGKVVHIGLRLNFPEETGWNRFGFEVSSNSKTGEAYEIAAYIVKSPWLRLAGVHAQIGTDIRKISQFRQLSGRISRFVESLRQEHNLELDWIDVGGGLAGISPKQEQIDIEYHALPSLNDYADAVIQPLQTRKAFL